MERMTEAFVLWWLSDMTKHINKYGLHAPLALPFFPFLHTIRAPSSGERQTFHERTELESFPSPKPNSTKWRGQSELQYATIILTKM